MTWAEAILLVWGVVFGFGMWWHGYVQGWLAGVAECTQTQREATKRETTS